MLKEAAAERMGPALDLIGKVPDRIIMGRMFPNQIIQCTKMDRLIQTTKIINKVLIFTVGQPKAIRVALTMRSLRMAVKIRSIILPGKITKV